jgi:hypothetical protein
LPTAWMVFLAGAAPLSIAVAVSIYSIPLIDEKLKKSESTDSEKYLSNSP